MARAQSQPVTSAHPVGRAPAGGARLARLAQEPVAAWLALAVVIALGLLQTALRFHHYRLGLLGDDYDFLLSRTGISVHTLLQPHNENLSAVGVLLYRAIFAVVGIRTATPYIALLFVSISACAVLAYVFVRRELGPWLALIAPLLLVTLGPAAEALLWPFEFTLLGALAFWLGAMLLIERDRTRPDAIGCALLLLAVGSQSVAVPLLGASALALVLWRGWRAALRRAWIVVLPLVLYALWYAIYHPTLERSLAKVPGFVVNSFVAAVADISGVGNHSPYVDVLAAAVLVAACLRCWQLHRVPVTTAYMSLGLFLVWFAAGLSEGAGRVPTESRYQFHAALLLMLALAPLVPRPRLTAASPRVLFGGALLAAALAAIVALNLARYGYWELAFTQQESAANAELSALEIARPAVAAPDQVFTHLNEPGLFWPFTPRAYFDAVDAHGSPVSVHRDLELASPPARALADLVLVRVEAIELVASLAHSGTARPLSVSGVPLQPAGPGCAVIPAGAAVNPFQLIAPPGGLIIRPDAGPPVRVGAARFSAPPAEVSLGEVRGASEAAISTKSDHSDIFWRVQLTGSQAVTVCSLAE
jgi:hypothetical protein